MGVGALSNCIAAARSVSSSTSALALSWAWPRSDASSTFTSWSSMLSRAGPGAELDSDGTKVNFDLSRPSAGPLSSLLSRFQTDLVSLNL
ncbi:hypothetical protein PF004_g30446 [Phytophthora fragariae]|uniref:Uncharacterized protein n=1 Tax=Phytophthora fragariae TaxID=53985 RepID=A0A6G0MCV1_9STRA|nr:hypothetical protein PF004_g30446 [Phytophthora fragariae]